MHYEIILHGIDEEGGTEKVVVEATRMVQKDGVLVFITHLGNGDKVMAEYTRSAIVGWREMN